MRELKALFVGAAASLLCTFLLLSTAYARAAEPTPQSFDINPQALAAALNQFARQSHEQILFTPDVVAQKFSSGVRGNMPPLAALQILLKDSGLTYSNTPNGAILIGAPGSTLAQSAAGGTADAALKEGKTSSSAGFRVAEAPQGTPSSTVPVEARSAPASNNAPGVLQEIVVTAQKRTENLQNVPISISVLNGADLDRSSVHGVSDALNTVPGVATTENYLGGGTSVVIRGVQAAGPLFAGSSATAYYLDSVPFALIRSAIAPDQNAYDLERVEVLRGPQGTLYGASALNGVVRVLTSDPDLSNFDLKVRAGGSNTQHGGANYSGDVAVNIPIVDGQWAARAVVGYENDSGWVDQVNKKDVNDAELRNYRIKLKGQPTDDLSIVLSAWSSRDDYGAPSFGYTFDKSSSVLDQPVVTDFDAYGLTVNYRFPGFTVSSMTSYLNYNNDGSLDLLPYGFTGSIFFSGLWSHVFSEELNFSSAQDGPWRWSFGGMFIRGSENVVQSYTLIGVPTETVLMDSKSQAEYGEISRFFLQDRLELTAGLRHYHDDVTQQGQLAPDAPWLTDGGKFDANTPRGVLTWHANANLMAYASYSQGFRSGFPQDTATPGGYPPVSPDRLRNYEIGSKGTLWQGLLSYDSAIYYMKWDGIQQQLYVPYAGIPAGAVAVVNAQSASGMGVDLSISAHPIQGLTITATGSWNNLEMDADVFSGGVVLFHKGDRPNYSPETTAGGSIDYRFPIGAQGYTADAGASVNYISQQSYRALITGGPVSVPLVQTGDPMTIGRVSFAITAPTHWTAMLYVDNVNNERGSPINAFAGVPNWASRVRPRTAGLQIEYHLR